MYKLFLCLRYLRSKVFAYFGMLCVALSVCLMLIAVSVFTGFLNKIERAAKGLFGDIVIEPYGERGLAYYDELIREVEALPEVEAADPFIHTVGILKVEVEGGSDYRQLVQIAGIRLPNRARVTDFEDGLFVQAGNPQPTFDPPLEEVIRRMEAYEGEMRAVVEREFAAELAKLTPDQRRTALGENWLALLVYLRDVSMPADKQRLLERMVESGRMRVDSLNRLKTALASRDRLRSLQAELAESRRRGATKAEIDALEEKMEELTDQTHFNPPAYRAILGLGIEGLSFRTDRGETVRYVTPGRRILLSIAPLGRRLSLGNEAFEMNSRTFTVIDDDLSGVYSIDSKFVYLPFDTLQELNNMGEERSADDPNQIVTPKRCSQVHVKVRNERANEADLRHVARQIEDLWLKFRQRYPDAATNDVGIETWRQRQAHVVEPLEKQRTLVIIVIAVIWIVVVVLIFVIFFTIVTQKTREIGALKAVGASGWGVAGVFLLYGAAVGLVGSLVGTAGGYVFVRHINVIQDWVDLHWGYRVWSRDQFMFDLIPNEVDWNAAGFILASSILAGLLGALLPAIRAARMQPVEALRYE